ncbi:unnamed protein product [Cylicocyclus nassatus]|uniref:BTB domain-containing protein n=1 Tax=Cylicocyclus nassatus TaxID=53992 RepID=A0AA36GIK1_CYLNA|nr:unnamed protein product [Cylicocyclus nassatus]
MASSSNIGNTLPTTHVPVSGGVTPVGTMVHAEKLSTTTTPTSKDKKKKGERPRIRKEDISNSTNFQRKAHVGWDQDNGFSNNMCDSEPLDESIKNIIIAAGQDPTNMNKKTIKFVLDFIEDYKDEEQSTQSNKAAVHLTPQCSPVPPPPPNRTVSLKTTSRPARPPPSPPSITSSPPFGRPLPQQRLIEMEDEGAKRTADQQPADAINSISRRLSQLYVDGDRLLRDAKGVPERYRKFAKELADECKKAKTLLQNAPKSHCSIEALKEILSRAHFVLSALQKRANNWDAFVRIREELKIELNNLRKPLEEALRKPRRFISDVRKDFKVISEEHRKATICYKVRKLQQLSELLEPLESPRADARFFHISAQQLKKEYKEALNEMSAEIEDEYLRCDEIFHFNVETSSIICDLLDRKPNQEIIENVGKFRLPALQAQLAALKKKYEEANHACKHVCPDPSLIARQENLMKSLVSKLDDAKKTSKKNELKRILVRIITEQLSQLKTIPISELTEDSLNEMENQIQTLPRNQADELQRQIENLRNVKKQHFSVHRTVLTHVEDATAAFPTAQEISQENSSLMKNFSKLTMGTACPANCGRILKVEVQVRDGEAAIPDSEFTKPTEFNNTCIAFKNSDMRVFVNKEYLMMNSQKFATLFTPERAESPASNLDRSESGDDFDIPSSRASMPEQPSRDDSVLNVNLFSSHDDGVPSPAVCEERVFLLEDVNIKDFIAFLETIYPPFHNITGENVESVLPTAFRFDVEHILKKCENYLRTEDARKSFDLLQRLVFATTYKMGSLQNDCLALLQNSFDVLLLLDDPRVRSRNIPSEANGASTTSNEGKADHLSKI